MFHDWSNKRPSSGRTRNVNRRGQKTESHTGQHEELTWRDSSIWASRGSSVKPNESWEKLVHDGSAGWSHRFSGIEGLRLKETWECDVLAVAPSVMQQVFWRIRSLNGDSASEDVFPDKGQKHKKCAQQKDFWKRSTTDTQQFQTENLKFSKKKEISWLNSGFFFIWSIQSCQRLTEHLFLFIAKNNFSRLDY